MSGFLARRATGSFPEWQKAGWDVGSNAAILLRTLIDPIESERCNVIMEHKDQLLFKDWLEKADVYSIQLDTADAYTKTFGVWSTKTVSGDGEELTEVSSIAALLNGPDRGLSLDGEYDSFDLTIYGHPAVETDSKDTGYEDEVFQVEVPLLFPNHLTLDVTGGRFFRTRENVQVTSIASFEIIGRDKYGMPISEVLELAHYSTMQTKHIYSYVDRIVGNEVRSLQWTLRQGRDINLYQKHPFLTAHTREAESTLYLRIYVAEERTLLSFNVRNAFLPEDHELNPELSYTEIGLVALMSGESGVEIRDWFVHPQNGLIYVLLNTRELVVYECKLPEFTLPSLNQLLTYNSLMSIRPERSYAFIGDRLRMTAYLLDPKDGITKIFIYRKSPSGVVEFLTSDKTWTSSETHFSYDRRVYSEWQDIKFDTSFSEDGQWEFYVQCTIDRETTLSCTTVISGNAQPLARMDARGTSMMLLRGHKIVVMEGNVCYEYTPQKLCYLADRESNKIYLVDQFETVEVI